jgi:anti-sigma factor RsiW
MQCQQVRGLAEAYISKQISGEAARAIVGHLARCPPCHGEVTGIRRLRASVRSAYLASTDLAPRPELVAVLRAELRSDRRRARTRAAWRRGWLALAATLALVAGGGLGVQGIGASGFAAILHAAVGDHRFCLVAFKLAERPIPLDRAADVYDDPVDRSLETVQPAAAQPGGGPVQIVERHSCVFGGRRFAHLVVRYKHELISLVVTPDARLLRHLPGASAPADGSIVTLAPVDGFHVAAFRGSDHAVFVISSLSDEEALQVARSMEPSVARALKGMR